MESGMITNKEDYLNNIDKYCLKGEEWRDVKGWEGLYQVSNCGRARSLNNTVNVVSSKTGLKYKRHNKGRILKLKYIRGYCNVSFSSAKLGKKTLQLHRLVLKAFKPIIDMDNLTVDHIEGNKHDNRVEKLEWVTSKENTFRAYKNGLIKIKEQDGELNHMSKLTKENVIEICENINNLNSINLAKIYNVNRKNIENIWNGKTWKTVTKNIKINKITEKLENDIIRFIFENPLNLNNWELSKQLNIHVHTIVNIHGKKCYTDVIKNLKLNKVGGAVMNLYKLTDIKNNKLYYTTNPRIFLTTMKICGMSKFKESLKNRTIFRDFKFEYCLENEYVDHLKTMYNNYIKLKRSAKEAQ